MLSVGNRGYFKEPSPPISAVISSMRSSGKGGSHSGLRAMLISFMGLSSAAAPVDNRPLSAFAHPHRNRVHDSAAVGGTVARFVVHMEAGQAVRTVVPMVAPRVFGGDKPSADLAGESVQTGMGFIVAFFQLFPFVFAVHLSSSYQKTSFCVRNGGMCFSQPPCQRTRSSNNAFSFKQYSFSAPEQPAER